MNLNISGFAAASSGFSALRWQSGEEYVFQYNGRMLTGLPELNTHYSGLGMKCKVHLQVQGENNFAIQVRDVEYSRVNQELSSRTQGLDEGNNWRKLELPSFIPVPAETAGKLGHLNLKVSCH